MTVAASPPRRASGRPTALDGLPGRPRLLRTAILAGAIVGMADATLVAIALDPMGRAFGQPLATSQAVIALYLVTVTATLPLVGRLADRFGRREVFAAGFALLTLGSVISATAPSWGVLLAGRVVQAVGGGALTSGALALAARWAPHRRTGRAVALIVIAQALAGLIAPPVGGLLVALGGWQAVFWATVPIGVAGAVLALVAVPADRSSGRPMTAPPLGAVGLGILLLGAGSGVSALGGTPVLGLPAPAWLGIAVVGVVVLVAGDPRLRRRGLISPASRRFGLAALCVGLSTGALMTCLALLPFWLEAAHGSSAALAGAAFLPAGVGIAATSSVAGRLADRGRTRTATAAGMAIAAGGLVLAAVAAAHDSWVLLPLGLLVLGAGNGLFSSPTTAGALGLAARGSLGGAAALLSTARTAGVVLGLGLTGSAWTVATRGDGAGRGDGVAAGTFLVAAAVCLVVGALSAAVWRRPMGTPD